MNKKFVYESLDGFSLVTPKESFFEYTFVERLRLPYLFSKSGIFLNLNTLKISSHEEESGSAHQALVDYLLGIVYCPDVGRVNYGGWFRALHEVSVKEGTLLVPEQLPKLLERSLAHFRARKKFRRFCKLLGRYINVKDETIKEEGLLYLLHATLFFAEHGSLLHPEERIEIERTLFFWWKRQKDEYLDSPKVRPGPGMEQSISSLLRSDFPAENCAALFLLGKIGPRLGEHVNPGAPFLKLIATFHAQQHASFPLLRFGLQLDLQCKQPCSEEEQEALHWLLGTLLNRPDDRASLLRWIQTKGALVGLSLERKKKFFPLDSYSALETLEKLRKNPLFDEEERFTAFLLRFQQGNSREQSIWALECRSYFANHPKETLVLSRLIASQRERGEKTLPDLFPLLLPGAIDCALEENIVELFPTFVSLLLESYAHTRGATPLFPLITSCGSDESFMTFATQLFQTLAQDASKNGEAFYQMVRHLNSMQRSDLLQKIAHDEALLASILDPHFGAVRAESAFLFDGWIRLSQALLESKPSYATAARLITLGRKLLPLSVQIPQGRSEVYHDFVHCALKLMHYVSGMQDFDSKEDANELLFASSGIILPALKKERVPKALVQAAVDLCLALDRNFSRLDAARFFLVTCLTCKAFQEIWLLSDRNTFEITGRVARHLASTYGPEAVGDNLNHPVRAIFNFLKHNLFSFNAIGENNLCSYSFYSIYDFYFSFLCICVDKEERASFFLSAMEALKKHFPVNHAYVTFCLLTRYSIEVDSDIGKLVSTYLDYVKIDELPLPRIAYAPKLYQGVLCFLFETYGVHLKRMLKERYIPFVNKLFASAQPETLGLVTATLSGQPSMLSGFEWRESKELRWALCAHHAGSLIGQGKPGHIMQQWQTILCHGCSVMNPDEMLSLMDCFFFLFRNDCFLEEGQLKGIYIPLKEEHPIWEKGLVQWMLHFKVGESLIPPDRKDVREAFTELLGRVLEVASQFALNSLEKEVQAILDQMQKRQQPLRETFRSDSIFKGIFLRKKT